MSGHTPWRKIRRTRVSGLPPANQDCSACREDVGACTCTEQCQATVCARGFWDMPKVSIRPQPLKPDSIAEMRTWCTPQMAAKVKHDVLALRAYMPMDEDDRRIDAMFYDNGPHRWFCFCMDAIAREDLCD